ncbi:protein-L-isoaspartate(D-aspartate) O-methyltransferase [Candidatus Omnitrophota bacterium]
MDFETLRNQMVTNQLSQRGINDQRVLSVFQKIPRHEFVSEQFKKSAYNDCPLPIGENQTISQPYMVALMTQCLGLKGGEKVLEIGTGSGYQTAILAALCKEVYSIERIQILADRAKAILQKLGFANVHIKVSDGTLGWKEHAAFDAIIVAAGAPRIPETLKEQLGNNGKIAIPVGDSYSQTLTIVEKTQDKYSTHNECGCTFVPLIGKHGWN